MGRRLCLLTSLLIFASCGLLKDKGPTAEPVDNGIAGLEVRVVNAHVMADSAAEVTARIRVHTAAADDRQRPEVNLVLVIDASASMRGEAIERAREAAGVAVRSLADGDQLSVVVFHSTTEVLVPSLRIDGDSRAGALAAIREMEATGTTDMAGGLTQGLQELKKGRKKKGINRMVLLSDGVPNDPTRVVSLASGARSYGATVSALGLGLDYDEILLGKIAEVSGGAFRYIENPEQVAAVFKGEVMKLNQVVAQNASLSLTFGPGVTVKAIHGQQSSVGGRRASISLGQLGMDETRDLFVVVDAPARSANATIEVMDAVLRYNDVVAGGASVERRAFVAVQATSDDAVIGKSLDRRIELEAARAAAAAATVQAIALARANQLDQAKALLTEAERTARRVAADHDDDAELIELAESMTETLEALPSFVSQVHPRPAGSPAFSDDAMPAAESMQRVKRSHEQASRALSR